MARNSMTFLIVLLQFLAASVVASGTCPPRCSCTGQTITCRQSGLRNLPIFPTMVSGPQGGALQFLIVSHNPMIRVEQNSFQNQLDLMQLELPFNQIVWVSEEAFSGLPRLKRLSLRGNRIAYLHHDVFASIYALTDLDLSRNLLKSIPFSLEGLIYLRRVSLYENPLHCPCELLDFAVSLIPLESPRSHVTCQSPIEVAHRKPSDMAQQMSQLESTTLLLGYQNAGEENREELFRHLPFTPILTGRHLKWPWPHCPVTDLGGFEPRIMLNSPNESEQSDTLSPQTSAQNEETEEFPNWRDIPQNVEIVAGEVARFICGANGHTTLQISWILPLNATKFIRLYRRRQILEIQETHDYHEGTYTCVLSNKRGQYLSVDATLKIVQPIKPKIIDAPPPDDNRIIAGSDLELRCSSHGRPRPKISWLWKDETLPLSLVTGGRYIVRNTIPGNEMPSHHINVYATNEFILNDMREWTINSQLLIRNITESDAHGRYICYASNRVGSARVSTVIHVVSPEDNTVPEATMLDKRPPDDSSTTTEFGGLSGEDLVHHVINKAKTRIEAAIQKTADRLRDPNRRRTTADVASLFRQPSRAALELAKAAEVYEAAIDEVTSILRDRNQGGLHVNGTEDFTKLPPDPTRDPNSREVLGVRLSADQLAIISQLSGCQEASNIDPCSHQLCFHLKYRSIDGACNNFNHPRWGAALTPFKRLLPPQYENGINTPIGWSPTRLYFGYPKPSARLVSRELLGNATLMNHHVNQLGALYEWNREHNTEHSSSRAIDDNVKLDRARQNLMRFEKHHGMIFDEDDTSSGMLMQWGQFLDHDLDFTPVDASISRFSDGLNCNETCMNDPPCFPILVPPGDPRIKHRCIGFSRSTATCGSGSTSILLGKPHYREQLNQITSFIDASNVYGSDEFENSQLRDTIHDEGKMRTGMPTPSGKKLLPFNIRGQVDCQADPQQDFVPCFKAGDHRSNENLGLLSMHTLWVREHNRLADDLRSLNPDWTGDRVYHEARKIVGACMQAITYQVWLPMILGPEGMKLLGSYTGYDDRVNPTISNEFATAAMRFGHTLVAPVLFRLDENWNAIPEGHLSLHQAFFAPDRMLKDGGMDPIVRGLLFNGVRDTSRSPPLNVELTERLFSMAHELALDLAALNIQRGRDHGLPGYTEYAHKFCGLGDSAHPESFDALSSRISNPEIRERLRKVYGHPGNIDLFTGGVLEDLLPGARVGPTFACIIADQFKRLRDGDRFWYEAQGVFTPAQLAEIKRAGSSLSRVICKASDNITHVPIDAFQRPRMDNDIMPCSEITELNMAAWIDCKPGVTDTYRSDISRIRRKRNLSPDAEPTCSSNQHATMQRLKDQIRDLERKFDDVAKTLANMTKSIV